jgi:hypothetical protein
MWTQGKGSLPADGQNDTLSSIICISHSKIKESDMGGIYIHTHRAYMWEMRHTNKFFAVKAEGMRPVVSLRHRRKNNIKIHLNAI